MSGGTLGVIGLRLRNPLLTSCVMLDRRFSTSSLELAWYLAGIYIPQRLVKRPGFSGETESPN
jgi:hypothetical protein